MVGFGLIKIFMFKPTFRSSNMNTIFPRMFLYFILAIISLAVTNVVSKTSPGLQYDLTPFITVYKNGTVDRLTNNVSMVPASIDLTTGIQSRDVMFAPRVNISVRLYLPKITISNKKLPLLVYFHGGAFFTESAFSPTYHNHINSLVSLANVVAVSVNYRLAPEHHLPIGYKDSWLALKWIFSHIEGHGTDPWLNNYVDFKRISLSGDSAGGNIAHVMAMKVGLKMGILLDGLFLDCPHFWGKKSIGKEDDPTNAFGKRLMEGIWTYAYPHSKGLDDPLVNPAMDMNLSKLECKRVFVVVAEIDILRDRGLYYNKTLGNSGWKGVVKAVEFKGEQHVFSVRFPARAASIEMRHQFASFLNDG